MAWKIERWLDEVFPGHTKIVTEYEGLTRRELSIVAASILDLALAELLSVKLVDYPKECESFLGLNEDGRAPCGTFGARIQLALLTGVIEPIDAEVFRAIKNVRNKMAHRVNMDLDSPAVVPLIQRVHELWSARVEQWIGRVAIPPEVRAEASERIRNDPDDAAAVIRVVLGTYQIVFHAIHGQLERIDFKRFSKPKL